MSTLRVAVQPPKKVQAGQVLYPPVIVQLSSTFVEQEFHYFAMAFLIRTDSGEVCDAELAGTITVNCQAYQSSLVFVFSNLSIYARGTFTIRVDVYKVAFQADSGTTLHEQIHTRHISVRQGAVSHQRPSSREAEFMTALQEAGIAV